MTVTIELCAGVTLEVSHTWQPQDHGTPAHYEIDECNLYVNGEEVEIEGVFEQMLGDAFSRTSSKLNDAIERAIETEEGF